MATPLGFTMLANTADSGHLGRIMGSADVGRELGDAGGPILVGAFGVLGLVFGMGALAAAVIVMPRPIRASPLD